MSEAEKAWLYARATAVLYPTVYEGFGLVPFEAAAAGTPCFWAPQSSLPEVLADAPAVIVPWDAEATADRVLPHLEDGSGLVDAVKAAAAALTWDRAAAELLDAYDEAVRLPARESAVLARAEMVTQSAYWGLRHDIGDTGMALVGPGEPLLPADAQRTLAGLLSRKATRGPIMRMLLRGRGEDEPPTLSA